ncbi:transposase [Bacillus mesophilus]|uniref:Transposase n=1 Tax=Bacillus mesophilus TaxID=1808955 RepID=A0A6M0Q7P6_9BACI|nr:transposase [Bacillus mesophilus]NEY72344.1 transposase [Bacillus mesophilus]
MPRKARKPSRSGVYHIIMRGINRQVIFEDEEDKDQFLEILVKYKRISGFELYGYCLMDNHVHLLLKEGEESISKVMMRICSSYVYWYNWKYERCGHLFQERYKSENVENKRYFLTVLRYIHHNPLKAGIVQSVWDSRWTSIHEYVQHVSIVDIDRGLRLLSEDRKVAIYSFKEYMEESNADKCLEYEVKLSDLEVRDYLFSLGIESSSMLQQMDRDQRDVILSKVKEIKGVSLGQISRITGISKSVIYRAK